MTPARAPLHVRVGVRRHLRGGFLHGEKRRRAWETRNGVRRNLKRRTFTFTSALLNVIESFLNSYVPLLPELQENQSDSTELIPRLRNDTRSGSPKGKPGRATVRLHAGGVHPTAALGRLPEPGEPAVVRRIHRALRYQLAATTPWKVLPNI